MKSRQIDTPNPSKSVLLATAWAAELICLPAVRSSGPVVYSADWTPLQLLGVAM